MQQKFSSIEKLVGVMVTVFATAVLWFLLHSFTAGSEKEFGSLLQFVKAFPFIVGPIAGFYAGRFYVIVADKIVEGR